MRSLLAVYLQSLLITTLTAHPSKTTKPVLLDARETTPNAVTDLILYTFVSPNCNQGLGVVNPLPTGIALSANHYDDQNYNIAGVGAFSSFAVNRDLAPGEVIDFSMAGNEYDGMPYPCSLFSQTVYPPVTARTCIPLDGPVTCYKVWHQ